VSQYTFKLQQVGNIAGAWWGSKKLSTFPPIKWLFIDFMDFAGAILIEIQVKLLGVQ
jgi:hypothetical protein